jgi:hypothetical protein
MACMMMMDLTARRVRQHDDGVEGRFNRRVFQQVPRIPVCSFSEKRRGRPRIFRFLIFRQFFPMAGK